MRPVIFYIDDEPHNLTVFETSLPDDWEICTFDNPLTALEALEKQTPWVIVSDQRMPQINGVRYLELARKIHPHAIRIIVTGYSDEDLVIESVRKAQVFDYIRKPWDPDELEVSIRRAIELYTANEQARKLQKELVEREAQLAKQNKELVTLTSELKTAHDRELELRQELECWTPPFVLWAVKEQIKFPIKKDIVGITFDIIDSTRIHEKKLNNVSVRTHIIRAFSECVLRNGGWRESLSGDSAYGHFGLHASALNPSEAALAAAREFRVALRSISRQLDEPIECGIALHLATQAVVDIHTVQIGSTHSTVTQKSFDTTSLEIDLLHRMEKLVHKLKGSNIIFSESFLKTLRTVPPHFVKLGSFIFKGTQNSQVLYLIPSDLVGQDELARFIQEYFGIEPLPKAA